MLAKIGIENFIEKNFDTYSSFPYDFNIELEMIQEQHGIKNIVSVMIFPTIEEVKIEKDELKLWIKIEIKAVFSLENGKLSLIQKNLRIYRKIRIEQLFEGMSLEELYVDKRLHYELLVLNFESNILKENILRVNTMLGLTINYIKDYSIAIVEGDDRSNLIILFDDGQRVKIIEEYVDSKIENVKWSRGKKIIFYKIQKDNSNIVRYNIKTESKDLMFRDFDNIYSFEYINENLVCIEGIIDNIKGVYLYNFIKQEVETLIELDENLIIEKIKYINIFEKLYFIRVEDNIRSICSIDLNGKSFLEHIVLKEEEFYFSKNFKVFFIFKERCIKIYDENWQELKKIFYPDITFSEISSIDVGKGEYLCSILTKESAKDSIYLYNFIENKFVNIKFLGLKPKINDLKFSSNGDFLLISTNGLKGVNLSKLTFNGEITELLANKNKKLDIYIK